MHSIVHAKYKTMIAKLCDGTKWEETKMWGTSVKKYWWPKLPFQVQAPNFRRKTFLDTSLEKFSALWRAALEWPNNLLIAWELVGAYSHGAWSECGNFTKDVMTQSNDGVIETCLIINFNDLMLNEVDFEACCINIGEFLCLPTSFNNHMV